MSKKLMTYERKVEKIISQILILEGELKFEPDDNKEMRLKTLRRRLATAKKNLKDCRW